MQLEVQAVTGDTVSERGVQGVGLEAVTDDAGDRGAAQLQGIGADELGYRLGRAGQQVGDAVQYANLGCRDDLRREVVVMRLRDESRQIFRCSHLRSSCRLPWPCHQAVPSAHDQERPVWFPQMTSTSRLPTPARPASR